MNKVIKILYFVIAFFSVIGFILFLLLLKNNELYNISFFKQTLISKLNYVFNIINIALIVIAIVLNIIKFSRIKVFSIISIIVMILALSITTLAIIKTNYRVEIMVSGSSMHPTHEDRDIIKVKKMNNLSRSDIILFTVSSNYNIYYHADTVFIKRIIGMPGDKLTIVDGYVYINDELYVEDYFPSDYLSSLKNPKSFDGEFKYVVDENVYSTYIIPDGYYFVLGDNREDGKSVDSSSIGLISEKNIIGEEIYEKK